MAKIRIEKITPRLAKEYLELNTCNFRKISDSLVAKYAADMSADKWELNGETIKFNGTDLIDGQHRLKAVVKSGRTIKMIVVDGITSGVSTIDRGKSRSLVQWLSFKGYRNSAHLAAIARLIEAFDIGRWHHCQIRDVPDSQLIECVEKYESEIQKLLALRGPTRKGISDCIVLAVVFMGSGRKNCDKCETAQWFIHSLKSGENIDSNDAVFHLRNRLLGQTQAATITTTMQRALITMAWNMTVDGVECSARRLQLRLTGPTKQPYPSEIKQAPD